MMDSLERNKHIKMINSPEDWPRWPVLPLKRSDGSYDVAIILAYKNCYGQESGIVVWETTMFTIPTKQIKNSANEGTHSVVDFEKLRQGRFVTYKNANEVVRAGWKVD